MVLYALLLLPLLLLVVLDSIPKALAVSKKTAAGMLGISVRSVENYLALKRIEARKIGRRTVVLVNSLEKFLRSDQPSASRTSSREGRDEQ